MLVLETLLLGAKRGNICLHQGVVRGSLLCNSFTLSGCPLVGYLLQGHRLQVFAVNDWREEAYRVLVVAARRHVGQPLLEVGSGLHKIYIIGI